jgi:hypothetical protein
MDGCHGIERAFPPFVADGFAEALDGFGSEPLTDSGLDSRNGGGDTESHPWPPVVVLWVSINTLTGGLGF